MVEIKKQLPVALGILILGGIAAMFLSSSGNTPDRILIPDKGPLVSVIETSVRDILPVINGQGTVRAKVKIQVVPQVSGIVTAVHPGFVSGGFFKEGETLISIDKTDYTFALHRAEAEYARAKVQLEIEEAERAVAQGEWEEVNPDEPPPSLLIVREPQVTLARAELEAARSELDAARLNLERTNVAVPFNGRVTEKFADVGQYVTAGQPVATVYGTDSVEIPVPLEDRELKWFSIPRSGVKMSENEAPVEVRATFAGRDNIWQGHISRTEGEVDHVTRMVNVIVQVDEPFDETHFNESLVPGIFVQVSISGNILNDVIRLPRYVVHGENIVWVAEKGKLLMREIEIVWKDRNHVYVSRDLGSGVSVISSDLDIATNGMNIRIDGGTDLLEDEAGSMENPGMES